MSAFAPGAAAVGIAFVFRATEGSGLPMGLSLQLLNLLVGLLECALGLLKSGLLLFQSLPQLGVFDRQLKDPVISPLSLRSELEQLR
jgi:hypothetical protein